MNLDDSLRAAVQEAVAPLAREVRQLRERFDKSLPPAFGTREDAARVLGCSMSTVDALIRRGEITTKRAGRRVLVDLTSLRPTSEEEVNEAVWAAKGGR